MMMLKLQLTRVTSDLPKGSIQLLCRMFFQCLSLLELGLGIGKLGRTGSLLVGSGLGGSTGALELLLEVGLGLFETTG